MNEQPENDKTEVRKDKEVGPRRPLLRSRRRSEDLGRRGRPRRALRLQPDAGARLLRGHPFLRRGRAARLPGARGCPARGRRNRPARAREHLDATRQGGAGLRPGRGGPLPRGRPRGGERLGHGDGPWHRHRDSGDRVRPRAGGGGVRRRHPPAHRPAARGRRRSCSGSRRQRSPPPTSTSTSPSASAPTPRPRRPTSRPTATGSAPDSSSSTCAACPGRRARRFRSRPISGSGR